MIDEIWILHPDACCCERSEGPLQIWEVALGFVVCLPGRKKVLGEIWKVEIQRMIIRLCQFILRHQTPGDNALFPGRLPARLVGARSP